MFRLGCLLFLLPFLEVILLIRMGGAFGVAPILGLVAGTGLLGLLVVRTVGVRSLTAARLEVSRGRLPGRTLVDGAAMLLGGGLLLTPGVITDLAGLSLLVPTVRNLLYGWMSVQVARAVQRGSMRVGVWGWGVGPGFGGGSSEAGPTMGDPTRDRGIVDRGSDENEDEDDPPPRPGEIVQR